MGAEACVSSVDTTRDKSFAKMGFGKEITKGMRLIQRNADLIPALVNPYDT